MTTKHTPHLPPELQALIAELAAETDVSTALALLATSKLLSGSAAKSLFTHPFLHTLGQVQGFTAALRRSPEFKPLVESLALEDRCLHLSTSLADHPDSHNFGRPDERRAVTYELCELIEELVISQNLRALALTVTGARNLIDIFLRAEQPLQRRAVHPFTQRLALDKLALTGTDIQSSFLLDWLHARQLILYTCDDAMWGMGVFNNICYSSCDKNKDSKKGQSVTAPLELIYCVGNVHDNADVEAAVYALLPLYKAVQIRHAYTKARFSRVVLRMRCGLVSAEQVRMVVNKGKALFSPAIEVSGWDTKYARSQVDAERLDFASGAWLRVGEQESAERHIELQGALTDWSNDDVSRILEEDEEDYGERPNALDLQVDALRDALLS